MISKTQWLRVSCFYPWLLGCLALDVFGIGGVFFATGDKPGDPRSKGWSLDWTYEQFIDGKSATSLARNQGPSSLAAKGYTNVRNRRSWYYLDQQAYHVVVISGSEPDGSAIYLMAGGSFESREQALKDAKELAWATWPFSAYQRYVIETYVLLKPETSAAINHLASDLNGPSDPGSGSGSGGDAPYIITNLEDLYLEEGESGEFVVHAGGKGPLTYRWSFNGGQTDTTSGTLPVRYAGLWQNGYAAKVEIINSAGRIESRVAILHVRQKQPNIVSISDGGYVPEGDIGNSTVDYTVSLEFPSEYGVYVDYSTLDGTAIAHRDYLPISGQILIPVGESSATLSVEIIGNEYVQPDRVFSLNLDRAYRAVLGGSRSSTIIEDDDSDVETFGAIDPSFSVNAASVSAIETAPDFGLYVAGAFSTINGVPRTSLARIKADGAVDPTYVPLLGDFSGNPPSIGDMEGSPNGDLWIVSRNLIMVDGNFAGSPEKHSLVKLDPTGRKAVGWRNTYDHGNTVGIVAQMRYFPDNNLLLIVGQTQDATTGAFQGFVSFYGPGPIPSMLTSGVNFTSQWILPTGERLMGNEKLTYHSTALRKFRVPAPISGLGGLHSAQIEEFTAAFPLDDTNQTFSGSVIHVDELGRILIWGTWVDATLQTRGGIYRIFSNGSLDGSFRFAQLDEVNSVSVQPDGKILVGGERQLYVNGTLYRYLARINSDGTIDPFFKFKEELSPSDYVVELETAGNHMAYVRFVLGSVKRVFTGPATLPDFNSPLQDQKQVLGGPVAYSVEATGMDPISYEWYLDGVQQADSGQIFQMTPTDPAFVGEHTLQVKAVNPVGTAETRVAKLTVLSPGAVPVITQQPVSHIAYQGEPPKFFVEATSPTPLRYQWYFDLKPLPGETGPALVGGIDTRDLTGTRWVYVDIYNDDWFVRSVFASLQVEPFEDYSTWRQEVFDPDLVDSIKSNPLSDLNHDGITNYQAFLMGLDPAENEGLAKRATRVFLRTATHDFVYFTHSITATRLQVYFVQSPDTINWDLAWGDVIQFYDTGRARTLLVQFPRESPVDAPLFYQAIYYFTE